MFLKKFIVVVIWRDLSSYIPFFQKQIAFAQFVKIHCDLWGPTPVASIQNFKYYVIFVDEHTRYTWLYPLKHKSNFFNTFLTFQWMVEINSSLRLKFINVMVVVSSLCKTFWLIWIIVGLLNRFYVPKHLSNMGLLNTNIGILWKLASPYCFTLSYLSIMA